MKKKGLLLALTLLFGGSLGCFGGCTERISPQDITNPSQYLDYVRTQKEGVLYVEAYFARAICGDSIYMEHKGEHIITTYNDGAEIYVYDDWHDEWQYHYNPDITKKEFDQVKLKARMEMREKIYEMRDIAREYTLQDGAWVAANGRSRFLIDGTKLVLQAVDKSTEECMTLTTIIYDYHIDLPSRAQKAKQDWLDNKN